MGIKQRRKMCRLYLDLSSWTLKRSSVLRVASVILIIETAGCVELLGLVLETADWRPPELP